MALQWKRHYWLYAFVIVALIVGIVLALVFGLRSPNTSSRDVSIEPLHSPSKSFLSEDEQLSQKARDVQKLLKVKTEKFNPSSSDEAVTPRTIPCDWRVRAELSVPSSVSPSFGFALSKIEPDLLVVGAPMDEGFGKVWLYQTRKDNGMVPVESVTFSFVGSSHQKAGYALRGQLVAAPDFTESENALVAVREGALFVLDSLLDTGEVSVRRLHLTPDTVDSVGAMVKFGDIFCHQHPWLYLTRRQKQKQFVEVYHFLGNRGDLEFYQRLQLENNDDDTINLFGYGLQASVDHKCVVVSDPYYNKIHVFARENVVTPFELVQTVNLTKLYEDQEDFKQQVSLSGDGDTLVVSSPDNNQAVVFVRREKTFEQVQVLKPEGPVDYFGMGLALRADALSLALSESLDAKRIHLYHRLSVNHAFLPVQKLNLTEHFPDTIMNTNLYWDNAGDLFVTGPSDGQHDGKVLWLTPL